MVSTVITKEFSKLLVNEFNRSLEVFSIFSPYVSLKSFEPYLSRRDIKINLMTRLSLKDFLSGASDFEAIKSAVENGWFVYVKNDIHLKTYMRDFNTFWIGSANFTQKGLGLIKNSNIESLARIEDPESNYIPFLQSLISQSLLITKRDLDVLDAALKEHMAESINEISSIDDDELLNKVSMEKKILASSLPQTSGVKELFKEYQSEKPSQEAKSDLAKYGVLEIEALSFEEFKKIVSEEFLSSSFMCQLKAAFRSETENFGYIRKFFERNCIDDPRPTRPKVNKLINNVFTWLEEIGSEEFQVFQPNHTKVIRILN